MIRRTCTTCANVALRGCDVPAKAPEARDVRAWLSTATPITRQIVHQTIARLYGVPDER